MIARPEGVSMAVWFASQAPAVPGWFKSDVPTPEYIGPESPYKKYGGEMFKLGCSAMNGRCAYPQGMEAFAEEFQAYQLACAAHQQVCESLRYFAWREYYGRKMAEAMAAYETA